MIVLIDTPAVSKQPSPEPQQVTASISSGKLHYDRYRREQGTPRQTPGGSITLYTPVSGYEPTVSSVKAATRLSQHTQEVMLVTNPIGLI